MKQDWENLLRDEMEKPYFKELWSFLEQEYASQGIYPPRNLVYTALDLTGYADVRVVILGQDPYHGEHQAHGLSFSVASGTAKYPPSLRNMFKELEADLGAVRTNRNLSDWAEQGILLLNTVLTVRAGQAASHRGRGWEHFTDAIIKLLNKRQEPVIFVLWGADARKKLPLIGGGHHQVITATHPSPLSAYNGFFGSKPYSQINSCLCAWGRPEIRWTEVT